MRCRTDTDERIDLYAQITPEEIMKILDTSESGLKSENIQYSRQKYGSNEDAADDKDSILHRLLKSFINPFSVVLLILALISLLTDILLPDNLNTRFTSVCIIFSMLLISGLVRFVQELKSRITAERLTKLISMTVRVRRDGIWSRRRAESIVAGDIVSLHAGDRVPADIRIISASDCYVSQSAVTGESDMLEKTACELEETPETIDGYKNMIFKGSNVTGGNCTGVVIAVGDRTVYGRTSIPLKNGRRGFDRGAESIAWVLIRFMVILVPVVFIASGITGGNWISSFIFALSVAVGLTPELLPMVINACLAKGSRNMEEKNTVVKNINAMQGFGSIDILCTDKTGTLTNDTLILEYYMDLFGREDRDVLDKAFLNSCFHSGIDNPLDTAVRRITDLPGSSAHFRELLSEYEKLDEIPFDHSRKCSSVLVKKDDRKQLIMKGDVFTVLDRCDHIKIRDDIYPVNDSAEESVHMIVDDMLEEGMKVLAVATKEISCSTLEDAGEEGLVLNGYIAFFDSPKKSAESAFKKLKKLNVKVKVLTGDNTEVALSVCRRIGMDTDAVMTGTELEKLTDNEIQIAVEEAEIFTELTPGQKTMIIEVLQSNEHTVGFLGDGMNDLPAMVKADVGISVDSSTEALKEAADVILLKKDLDVLEEGILEGRKAFVNMSKYIRITASSNFGNIASIVIASIFLPFFPMTSIQLLLLNLLYDILCLVLPWDKVDEDLYSRPLEWSGKTLGRFMLFFGPVSSLFDIFTFCFLWFLFCPGVCGGSFYMLEPQDQTLFISLFQTGWFLESMWTQVLILHMLRTKHVPFIQSRASGPVQTVTAAGIILFTVSAMTPAGGFLGMTALPFVYFIFLFTVVSAYLLMILLSKKYM